MYTKDVVITNATGLHARPAQKFVQTANQFHSSIQIIKEDTNAQADAKSILGIMTMALDRGSKITIQANGSDETEAVNTLVELVKSKFGEAE